MNQTYNCTDLFPTWYKAIDPSVTADIVKKRIDAINIIIELNDSKLWLDIVKIAYGITDYDPINKTVFETKFKDNDISFPITSNNNIVKVLAEISLCFLFESGNILSQCISMAVINANFFEQYFASDIPFYLYANDKNIEKQSDENIEYNEIEGRLLEKESELEEEDEEEEDEIMTKEDSLDLLKMVNFLNKENKKLKEETNVLWWLFGQHSSLNNAYFYDLGVPKMILASAQELFDLIIHTGYIHSAKHILSKALISSNNNKLKFKDISLSESIIAASPNIKQKLLSHGELGNLTPLLYGISLEKQFENPSIWKNAYNQKIGSGNIDKKFRPEEIAFQFYREIVFLNLYKL